jgi:alpha-tubulin suppressor-like RCC1 family protein
MKAPHKLKISCLLCAAMLYVVTSRAQPVTQVAAGNAHSSFLKSDGSLWTTGWNYYGQLGDGTYDVYPPNYGTNQPQQIVASNATAIVAGYGHSLFLKSDGSLWAMGYNYFGQLGDGTTGLDPYYFSGTNVPEQIVASNVIAIAAGISHSLFLKSDGSLWVMGENEVGELGDGTFVNAYSPEQIVASNVTAIAAGGSDSLFLKSDGSLWVMGWNSYGQLGDGTHYNSNIPGQIVASNVTAIAAGYYHSLFLKRDGSLWSMGDNEDGQLGDGTYNNTNQPEKIVAGNVAGIAAGGNHSLFLKSDGSLWAMGDNGNGQLGDGTFNSTNLPEEIVANEYIFTTNGDNTITITAYTGDGGDVTIPDTINGLPVTCVGSGAFSLTSVTSVTIPNSVTSIAVGAFARCWSLNSVIIGNGVTFLNNYAFWSCTSLADIYFQGDAPGFGADVFVGEENVATIYYLPGTSGWGPTFGGVLFGGTIFGAVPTMLWNPQVQVNDGGFGVQTNQFGFNITGTSGLVIVVEACTSLCDPLWQPVQTNTITGGSFYFGDAQWTNYPGRFYRIHSPFTAE